MSVEMKLDFEQDGTHLVEVATADELIEFVNIGRKAGGANILDALLPSTPVSPTACLIANALNFNCSVGVRYTDDRSTIHAWPSGAWQWIMILPPNMSREQSTKIVRAYELELVKARHMLLPEHIGNAARAFDEGQAFQEFGGTE